MSYVQTTHKHNASGHGCCQGRKNTHKSTIPLTNIVVSLNSYLHCCGRSGSGWAAALRCCQSLRSAPAAADIHSRHTLDANSGTNSTSWQVNQPNNPSWEKITRKSCSCRFPPQNVMKQQRKRGWWRERENTSYEMPWYSKNDILLSSFTSFLVTSLCSIPQAASPYVCERSSREEECRRTVISLRPAGKPLLNSNQISGRQISLHSTHIHQPYQGSVRGRHQFRYRIRRLPYIHLFPATTWSQHKLHSN